MAQSQGPGNNVNHGSNGNQGNGNGEKMIGMMRTSEILGVSYKTIRKYCNNGLLPCYIYGPQGHRYFKEEDVIAFRDSNRFHPK